MPTATVAGAARWWLLHCDQRRRRAAHKSGRESLHSFWSKGKIGEGEGGEVRREEGHFWKRPRRVAKNGAEEEGREEGREGGRGGAPMQWRREEDDDDDCAT